MLKSKQSKRFAVCMTLVVALLVLGVVKPMIFGALLLLAVGIAVASVIILCIWELCE